MRIAIIQFPGSNCERETMLAVKRVGMEPVEFLWNQSHTSLAGFDGYIIVGGFSYEDRSRSGIIAALDPIMQTIREQSECGKPVLGICNGAQILVETGLVPGLANHHIGMALTDNKQIVNGQIQGTGFYNAWVHIRLSDHHQQGAFTRHLTPKQPIYLPVAHGEGRFVIPDTLLTEMQKNGLNVFQYCDADGKVVNEFPVNPNGSVDNIAAVSNYRGNVMAMMPHPERTTAGDAIFQSMRDYIAVNEKSNKMPLTYMPSFAPIQHYQVNKAAREVRIELMITDNHAMSVKNQLNHAGIPVTIKRQIHWEITCDNDADYQKIIHSDMLYNKQKEYLPVTSSSKSASQVSFLVRAKEDMLGRQKQQQLEKHLGIKGIHSIRHGVLWHLETHENMNTLTHYLNQSHLLYNPYAHDYYYY